MIRPNPRGAIKLHGLSLHNAALTIAHDYFNPRTSAVEGHFKQVLLRFRHPFKPWIDVRLPVLWTITRFRPSTLKKAPSGYYDGFQKRQERFKATEEDLILQWENRKEGLLPRIVQNANVPMIALPPSLGYFLLGTDKEHLLFEVFPKLSRKWRRRGAVRGAKSFERMITLWLARPTNLRTLSATYNLNTVYETVYRTVAHEMTHVVDKLAKLDVTPVRTLEAYTKSQSEQRARNSEIWATMVRNKDALLEHVAILPPSARGAAFVEAVLRDVYYRHSYLVQEWEALPEEEKRNKLRLIAKFWEKVKNEVVEEERWMKFWERQAAK